MGLPGNHPLSGPQLRRGQLGRSQPPILEGHVGKKVPVPKSCLYNEALTGCTRSIPCCQHSLSEDHYGSNCPHNPNQHLVGWIQDPNQHQRSALPAHLLSSSVIPQPKPVRTGQEICHNFNAGHCRFTRFRLLHICSECLSPHAALHCTRRVPPPGQQSAPHNRIPTHS